MGVVERFERRLEGIVGDTFARVFGGKVVTQELAQALQRDAESGIRRLPGQHMLAPNHYTVVLSERDHEQQRGQEDRFQQLLSGSVAEHIAERGWQTYGPVVVSLERSDTLHTGQFRTSATVDPDVDRPSSHAGESAMSQPPGRHSQADPNEPDRQDPRGEPGWGSNAPDPYNQDPNAAQQSWGQQGWGQPDWGQQGWGQSDWGQQGWGQQGWGQPDPYAQNPYGQNPYAQNPYGQDPYAAQQPWGAPQDPYAQDPYAQDPYAQDPYAQDPYGQDPYSQNPYAGQAPWGAPPPGQQDSQQGGYPSPAPAPGASPVAPQGWPGAGSDWNSGADWGNPPPPPQPMQRADQQQTPGYPPPGGRAPQLGAVLQLDDGSQRTYQLVQGNNVVGRGQDASFRLPDTGVSRRHFEIAWDSQQALLTDLGSTNGTSINGTPIQAWQLADGDIIKAGHSTLIFRLQG